MKKPPSSHCAVLGIVCLLSIGAAHHIHAQTTVNWLANATSSDWATGSNWQGGTAAPSDGTFNVRLNVNGPQTLIYSAAQGNTTYARSAERGVVIGSGASGTNGSLTITGGTFSTLGSTTIDVISNADNGTAILTIAGGTFIGSNAGMSIGIGAGNNRTGILNVNSGSATFATLTTNTNNATINLNGGTLSANQITTAGGASTINFNGGTLQARTSTVAFLQGLTAANMRSGGLVVDSNGSNVTIAQTILDGTGGTGGNLTKVGAGTLTLTANNAYVGLTTVSAGTLALSGAGRINASSGVVINGSSAKLNYSVTGALTPAVTLTQGTLTGSGTVNTVTVGAGTGGMISNNDGFGGAAFTIGNLTLTGAANLTLFSSTTSAPLIIGSLVNNAALNEVVLTANNTGGWLSGNTYDIISYSSLGGSGGNNFARIVNNLTSRQSASWGDTGSAITLTISGDTPVWTGAAGDGWNTTDTNWKLLAGGTPTEFINGDAVRFDDTATGTTDIDINSGNVTTAAMVFDNSSVFYTVYSSAGYGISSGSLTKNGTSDLILGTENTFSGATIVNGGNLFLDNLKALQNSAVDTSGAGTFQFNIPGGAPYVFGSLGGTGNLNMGALNLIVGGNNQSSSLSGNLTVGSLTKNGTGTMTLAGTNTIAGTLTINEGTVRLGSNNGVGSAASLVLANVFGATFDLNNYDATVAGLSGGGATGGTVAMGTGNLTITTAGAFGGTFTGSGLITVAAGNLTPGRASASFTGNLLIKTGAILTLGTTHSYFGPNTATTQTITIEDGGTFRMQNGNNATNQPYNLVISGNGTGLGAIQSTGMGFGNNGIRGLAVANDATVYVNRWAAADLRGFNVAGPLAGAGNLTISGGPISAFVQFSTGAGAIGSYSAFTGNINVRSAGTATTGLISNNATAIGSVANVDLGDYTYFTLGASQTIGGLSSTVGTLFNSVVNLGANTLTIGSTNNLSSSYNGVIQGTGRLIKAGTGNLTLAGVNTYTGNTTISGGTLILTDTGSIANSAGINLGTLASQGVLDVSAKASFAIGASQPLTGYGQIILGAGKTLTINGALNPGNSPGQISVVGDTALTSSTVTTMELAGGGGVVGVDFDNLTTSGALTYAGTLSIVSFGGFSLDTAGIYDLFSFASYTGNFSSISVGATSLASSGSTWTGTNGVSDYTFNLASGDLIISPVPEPSTWALLGMGLAVFLLIRRRARKTA